MEPSGLSALFKNLARIFRFYSKNVADESSMDDVDNVDNVVVGINDDDDDFICAFYELPDIDQHDEEKFFTLLRWNYPNRDPELSSDSSRCGTKVVQLFAFISKADR